MFKEFDIESQEDYLDNKHLFDPLIDATEKYLNGDEKGARDIMRNQGDPNLTFGENWANIRRVASKLTK